MVILIGFGHDEIGHMLFMRLHGLNVKKHVNGWKFFFIVFVDFFFLIGS